MYILLSLIFPLNIFVKLNCFLWYKYFWLSLVIRTLNYFLLHLSLHLINYLCVLYWKLSLWFSLNVALSRKPVLTISAEFLLYFHGDLYVLLQCTSLSTSYLDTPVVITATQQKFISNKLDINSYLTNWIFRKSAKYIDNTYTYAFDY